MFFEETLSYDDDDILYSLQETIDEFLTEHIQCVHVSVYKNTKKNHEIYLRHPERLTVSDFQGYKFSHTRYLEYDRENEQYFTPYSMEPPIKEFDDFYHPFETLPHGEYKIKLKYRDVRKRTKSGKEKKTGVQYCSDPSKIKRTNTVGFSSFGPWKKCIAKKVVRKDGSEFFTHNDNEIQLDDMVKN